MEICPIYGPLSRLSEFIDLHLSSITPKVVPYHLHFQGSNEKKLRFYDQTTFVCAMEGKLFSSDELSETDLKWKPSDKQLLEVVVECQAIETRESREYEVSENSMTPGIQLFLVLANILQFQVGATN